jgi:hypothetical protein
MFLREIPSLDSIAMNGVKAYSLQKDCLDAELCSDCIVDWQITIKFSTLFKRDILCSILRR